jgi:peptide deformylase
MAILKIALMGHPVLARPAEEVKDPTAPEVRRLILDMIETMRDADGLGLAAPQVHVPKRVVVFCSVNEAGEIARSGMTVLINPRIQPLTEERDEGWEGCLSVPGLRGLVPRYRRVRYSALAPDGGRIDREAQGLHARVVQHECDHLDGILYPQRMTDLSQLMFLSELKHRLSPREAELIPAES